MGIKIDTLPPALRAQVEAKLRAEDTRRLARLREIEDRQAEKKGLVYA